MYIQLQGREAKAYKNFLSLYKAKTGEEPTASERTEAYICARMNEFPCWISSYIEREENDC